MIIKLKHNFFVEVDEKNFTLKSEYTNQKTKEKATRTHGYYSSLGSATKNYIKLATLDANDTDMFTKTVAELTEVIGNIHDNPELLKGEM